MAPDTATAWRQRARSVREGRRRHRRGRRPGPCRRRSGWPAPARRSWSTIWPARSTPPDVLAEIEAAGSKGVAVAGDISAAHHRGQLVERRIGLGGLSIVVEQRRDHPGPHAVQHVRRRLGRGHRRTPSRALSADPATPRRIGRPRPRRPPTVRCTGGSSTPRRRPASRDRSGRPTTAPPRQGSPRWRPRLPVA